MNSFFPAEGENPHNYMADQSRLQISELQFDKFTTPATFSCWKIKFKTQVSACSSSPSEAMLWIKEVEVVDSVDDLKSSRVPRPPVSTNCQSDFGETAFTVQNYDGCTSDKIRQHI